MKSICFIIFVIFMFSCVPKEFITKNIPGENFSYFLDFRPYVEKGFTFSTGDINQNYTPIGTINLIMTPDTVQKLKPYGNYWNTAGKKIIENEEKKYFIWEVGTIKPDISMVLDEMYKTAIEYGGNGIVFFKTEYKENNISESTGTVISIIK